MDIGQRISPTSSDLFATIYEQTQLILGRICGFYIVAYDSERDIARVEYFVDGDVVTTPGTTFRGADCDCIRDRRTLINTDFVRLIAPQAVNSISIPMIRNDVVLGSFGVFSREERVYDARDAIALQAIAQLGALALENARFVGEIEKGRLEAERLEEIGRAISASLDLSQVLKGVARAARELLGADGATVWLMRGEREVEVAMTSGEVAPPKGLVMPVPEQLRHRMADMRKPYFVYEDMKDEATDLPAQMRNLTVAASTMAVALLADDQLLGALSVAHRERVRFRPTDIRLLQRISLQAAIAVANARLHEQIHALSLTDPLTSMPNRRHLNMFLEKEFAAARRGRELSVLLFDLDNFKPYNDQHGHQAGDSVLRAFAEVLATQTRAMNLAARYGGDEFIAVLADADEEGATTHAHRILQAIELDPLLSDAGLSASVGIASYDPEMVSFEDLIRAADRDMYLRKSSRREITA